MASNKETPYSCEFDSSDFANTFQKCEALAEIETCPHIRKASPEAGDVELYAMMDSDCHIKQPHLDGPCGKTESSYMRLIAKRPIEKRSVKPQAVTCTLKSFSPDLMRFSEGRTEGPFSILDLKENPIWIVPVYKKSVIPNKGEKVLKVEKFPVDVILWASIQIDVFIWKNYPNGSSSKQLANLSVAIPPKDHKDHMEEAILANEEKGEAEIKPMEVDTLTKPVEVFYSYSHKDEKLRDELVKHLSILKRNRVITGWHDREIIPGTEWKEEIDKHLDSAGIILLLISADFLDSDYCWGVEMTRAIERHNAGEARVIPVLLRGVDWSDAPFSKLQALPTNALPITSWVNPDEAFADVAKGIRKAVNELSQ